MYLSLLLLDLLQVIWHDNIVLQFCLKNVFLYSTCYDEKVSRIAEMQKHNHLVHSLPHNHWIDFSLGVDSCLFMWKRAGHRRCLFQPIGNFQVERTAHCSNHWVGELGEQCAISTMWEGKTNPRFLGRNLHDSSGLCCFEQMKSSWEQRYFRNFFNCCTKHIEGHI